MTASTKVEALSDAPIRYPRALAQEMRYHDVSTSPWAQSIVLARDLVDRRGELPPMTGGYAPTIRDFGESLRSFGVGRYFSVGELIIPNHTPKAIQAGYAAFVPPPHLWGVTVILLWIADRLRHYACGPVRLRNYWRPQSYNRLVSTSKIDSDHPNACAFDLDFADAAARERAQAWLEGFAVGWGERLKLSVGYGAQTLHVGVLSPQGRRTWTYDSFAGERLRPGAM